MLRYAHELGITDKLAALSPPKTSSNSTAIPANYPAWSPLPNTAPPGASGGRNTTAAGCISLNSAKQIPTFAYPAAEKAFLRCDQIRERNSSAGTATTLPSRQMYMGNPSRAYGQPAIPSE